MSAKVCIDHSDGVIRRRPGDVPRFVTSPQTLQEDTAGVLLKVVTDGVPCEVINDRGEAMRGERYPDPVVVIIPGGEYAAFQAFKVAKEAFRAIL